MIPFMKVMIMKKKKLIRLCNSVGRYIEFMPSGLIICADYDFGCDRQLYENIDDALIGESKYIPKHRRKKVCNHE